MISVEQALSLIFDLITPVPDESVPLRQAPGRVLREPAIATRDQPPFAASSMDGYAVQAGDVAPGAVFQVIGAAAAGHGTDLTVGAGQATRIFTGAPVPSGADHVVIQEDVTADGDRITLCHTPGNGPNIRAAGADFKVGDRFDAPTRLGAHDVAMLASMNIPDLIVSRKPVVALMATGDELVMPGEVLGPDQIIASNSFGLAALAQDAGAEVRMLPIARDNRASLEQNFELASGADLIITIGGASVGDHDLVGPVARDLGMEQSFYKIAMRPGKPLMAGRLGDSIMIGLPGNPVSSMVCGHIFMVPVLRALQGLPAEPATRWQAVLTDPLPANGPREHYMRAVVDSTGIRANDRQDSALLSVLSSSSALLVRPPNAPVGAIGETVDYIPI